MSLKKALIAALALCLCALPTLSCTATPEDTVPSTDAPADPVTDTHTGSLTDAPTDPVTDTPTEGETDPEGDPVFDLVVAEPGDRRSGYRLVYDQTADTPLTAEAEMLRAMIFSYTGADLRIEDTSRTNSREIVLASQSRPETAAGERKERPTFLAIKEVDGMLVWDEPKPVEE